MPGGGPGPGQARPSPPLTLQLNASGPSRDTARAMSQENVDRFVQGIEAYRNGRFTHYIDFGDRDQALEVAGLRE